MKRRRLRISKVAGNATGGSGGAGEDEDYEAQYHPLKRAPIFGSLLPTPLRGGLRNRRAYFIS